MNILNRTNSHRGEFIEHHKVGGVRQLHQKFRRHGNAWQRLGRGHRRRRVNHRVVKVVGGPVAPVRPLEFGKSLVHQLAGDATQVEQRWLLNLTQLLIVDKHQGSDDLQAVLRVQVLHVRKWTPVNGLVAVLLPAAQIRRVQTLLLVVDGGLGQNGHSE